MSYRFDRPDWFQRAACRDCAPDVFFPHEYRKAGRPKATGRHDPDTEATRAAKAVCGLCPVRSDCLTYALDNDIPDGVWGGRTPQERNKIRRHK